MFLQQATPAKAASCVTWGVGFVGSPPPKEISAGETPSYEITLNGSGFTTGANFTLLFRNRVAGTTWDNPIQIGSEEVKAGKLSFTVTDDSVLKENGPKLLQLKNTSTSEVCDLWEYSVSTMLTCGKISFSQASVDNASCLDNKSGKIVATIDGMRYAGKPYNDTNFTVQVLSDGLSITGVGSGAVLSPAVNGKATLTFDPSQVKAGVNFRLEVIDSGKHVRCEVPQFEIFNLACTDREPKPGSGDNTEFLLCNQIPDQTLQAQCRKCATQGEGGENEQGGVWTAVGCISRNPVNIAKRMIQVGLGMGGGVALIMTLAGGFILATSQGDPQKANQAKEMITNSVIGLLFVIFSVVILQFIGFKILAIPGFGTTTQQATP